LGTLLAACCVLAVVLRPATAAEEAERQSLRSAVDELLEVLEEGSLLPDDGPDARRAILGAILEALGLDARLERAAGTVAGGEMVTLVAGQTTLRGYFLYIQLLAIEPGLAREVNGLLRDADSHYSGIVLDLRAARGGDMDSAGAVVETLKALDLPLAILIDKRTAGAAEVLASRAEAACDAITIGQPTAGFPFPSYSVTLDSGDTIRLPKVTADGEAPRQWSCRPIQPDVRVEQVMDPAELRDPQRHEIATGDTLIDSDLALQKAVDLLTAVKALENTHFGPGHEDTGQ
jgi:hypothetical protein